MDLLRNKTPSNGPDDVQLAYFYVWLKIQIWNIYNCKAPIFEDNAWLCWYKFCSQETGSDEFLSTTESHSDETPMEGMHELAMRDVQNRRQYFFQSGK